MKFIQKHNILCKNCGKEQSLFGLDEKHMFCPAHTGDEHENGIGLVCLNMEDSKDRCGKCPDCGQIIVEKKKSGKVLTYKVDSNHQMIDPLYL